LHTSRLRHYTSIGLLSMVFLAKKAHMEKNKVE